MEQEKEEYCSRWKSRAGCWDNIVKLEHSMERHMTERERDLFEYAYVEGYDRLRQENGLLRKMNVEFESKFHTLNMENARLKEGWEVIARLPMSEHPSDTREFAKRMLKGETPYKLNG